MVIRRLVAIMIDILIIIIYAGVLFIINYSFGLSDMKYGEVTNNIIGLVTMIIPTSLYFYLSEQRYGASIGKKVMKLRVRYNRMNLTDRIIRITAFIMPWIFGHVFVYHGFYTDWKGNIITVIFASLAYTLLITNILLVVIRKDHRGFHELLSKSFCIQEKNINF